MADVIVIGGGVAGLCGSLLLARDGHRVRLLERDPAPPPESADAAWTEWERRGVNQFRLLHYFLPRFRQTIEAELPDLVAALEAAGALRTNPVFNMPAEFSGGIRPDDDRFTSITGRRPVIEAAIARVVAAEPGVDVRRGTAVRALLTGEPDQADVPRVVGVVTDDGEELRADLVVDASGRRSALPRWLTDAGARAPEDDVADSGFVYYGRHFCSPDGSVPFAFGPPLQPYDSISMLTLPADNGTWSVALITSGADPTLRAARDLPTWEQVIKSYPLVAHWLDGEPISGVDVMAKIEDRRRTFWLDGAPVATGVIAMADSWACTNPSVGRGASIGLLHAVCLRDLLREVPVAAGLELAKRWEELTATVVAPLVDDTLAFDRHRLGEMEAQIAGVPYETDDPGWKLGEALRTGATRDPDLLRAYASIASLLERGVDVLSQPGIAERAIELASDEPAPGPSRAELVALVAG
jgi:2-polyprenyl-6-methoxyphenol hydroxylase-like FAD-dependent oxidoreductase